MDNKNMIILITDTAHANVCVTNRATIKYMLYAGGTESGMYKSTVKNMSQ